MESLLSRPRRNRRTESLRALVRETKLDVSDLVQPLFLCEGTRLSTSIAAMPGQCRFSPDLLMDEARKLADRGIGAIALFPAISADLKDPWAKEALNPEGLIPRTVAALKKALPQLTVITDVALDPYSSDGHDGVVRDGMILNDETVEILCAQALTQARAGADLVAPSDMMDGRIGAIRRALDREGFTDVGILSYAVKYASAFYGPFRDALDSAPKTGDKKTYQMDPANVREALREVALDVTEGADLVMVKPAGAYLDVIARVRQAVDIPVAAYQVSGEYSMIVAASEREWIKREAAALESLIAIKRAGADVIFTYFAGEIAPLL